jgi:hypothetical protein
MNDTPKVEVRKKKSYTKPMVEQILLKPEEAVLGICKVNGVSGPPSKSNCGFPLRCLSGTS